MRRITGEYELLAEDLILVIWWQNQIPSSRKEGAEWWQNTPSSFIQLSVPLTEWKSSLQINKKYKKQAQKNVNVPNG